MRAIVESQLEPRATASDDLDPKRLMLLHPAEALEEAKTLYQLTPFEADARRWAIVNLAGKLETPAAVGFLSSVASAPLPLVHPEPEGLNASPNDHSSHCGFSDLEKEMVVRISAIRSLANMKGAPRADARQALLNLVAIGERLIRREAAAALLLSSPTGDPVAGELRRLLPVADQDVLAFQRKQRPDRGPPGLSAGSTKRSATIDSSTAPAK